MKINMLSEEDSPLWSGYLYQLQEEAPRPRPILTNSPEAAIGRPYYFGDECHGLISREEGDALCNEEGNFLIRESQNERGRYTLVLRILGAVKNFKLYWEDGQFFVGDKRFDNIYALVEDGLITMYVEEKAHDYIQNMSKDKSVYSSLSKTKRLLTGHPDYCQPRAAKVDARGSPRRAASVRVNGDSPRYANNGRNTENAALPYTHYQGPEYFDPSCPEQNTAALEDQLVATRLQRAPSNNACYNSSQTGQSMLQNLLNSRREPYERVTFQNGTPYLETTISNGGAKKSLTPTSSDERKRPKAKKIATEQAVGQQQFDSYKNEIQFSQEAQMCAKKHQDLERSYSDGSSSHLDGERRHFPARLKVPSHLQNRSFHQSASSKDLPQRSPMLRNNSDPNQVSHSPYQYSIMAQLTQSNIAHVRHLGPGQPNNTAVGANTQISATEQTGSVVEKITLDANDNQMVVSTAGHPRYHSPNRARHSPRQHGFDSSGSEMIPANTFQQLKMFHKRLEEDDGIHKEAQDEVTTLRGHPKNPLRLTRSHTTAGIAASAARPHSGGKAHPRPAPRDVHFRQRSEPVELLQPARASSSNSCQHPFGSVDFALYRQHSHAYRQKEPCSTVDQGELRAGSGSSCNSSLSNLSSAGSTAMPHIFEANQKLPDSISHLSSEDWTAGERESSPSPYSTSQRSRSSDDNSLPNSRGSRTHLGRQNAVIYADHPESRDVITALQRVSPKLKADQKTNAGNHCRSASVPPPEALSGTKPRRKTSDLQTSVKTKQTDDSNKTRHHSETSSSEDGTIRTPYPAHKPLQRRATTGSKVAKEKEPSTNGFVSPVKLFSPKKPAHRSNSGPSPRKGKKSPDNTMSPRTQHINHQRSLSSPRSEVYYYDKEHVFKSHTYRGLQWCEYCGNFMWGIIQQGMQCRDCGLNVHKQCSKLVPGDCQPALKHIKTVFGIDLTALVKLHGTERPIVIDKCIAEIETRGMNSEGIYRVSGFHDDVQQLKLLFDRYGNEVDLASYEDINIVAGGLKLYLRELPVPLIPYNLYSRFINAAKLSYGDGKLDAIRTALDVMPPAHLQTLKHIIQHLGRVCDREVNQMDSQNLGIIFGPTMLRPPEKSVLSRYNLNDAQYQKEIVQTIIENRCKLFGPKKDLAIRETHNL